MFVSVEHGVKTYGSGNGEVRALDSVSFSLEKGQICVILGPSGSGKSTLMNMIGGIDSLDSGILMVDGQEISSYSQKELTVYRKDKVGFIFQYYNLIDDLSAEENIKVVSDICDNPLDIDELMESLGIRDVRYRFPKELSGGQQQRVAIARAMVKNPKLLLCDELTGALDSHSSKSVLEAVETLNEKYGTTVIIITHNDMIADMADQITIIKDGRVSCSVPNTRKLPVAQIEL